MQIPKVILYARVSTIEQARHGYGIRQQLERGREWAFENGYEVLEEIVDAGQSEASLERPGMDEVRDRVAGEAGGVAAVWGELPGVEWQRCVVHFERNVLSHVPASSMAEVAEDIKAIFKVRREKTALVLAEEFVELYAKRFPKAVAVFEAGISDALTYLGHPGLHHARIRTTNMLERLFREVKRRTRVIGVFPNETSATTLATEIALRSSEEWALKHLPHDGRSRRSKETKPTTFETLTTVEASSCEGYNKLCTIILI